MKWHRVVRLLGLVAIVVLAAVLVGRLRKTPEQEDLTRYVELEIPALTAEETPIRERVDSLGHAPGPGPEEARRLLVDDVIPRLLKLKKTAGAYQPQTAVVRTLHVEYVKVTDRLLDACRACVRVIDDPKLSTAEGLKTVRAEFAAVRTAYAAWQDHVTEACRQHRLHRPGVPALTAPPPGAVAPPPAPARPDGG